MHPRALGLHRQFMYLKDLPLRDSRKRLQSYHSRITDQRVTMIVKAHICHYIQEGQKQTLFIGGTSDDYKILYQTLADLMTPEGEEAIVRTAAKRVKITLTSTGNNSTTSLGTDGGKRGVSHQDKCTGKRRGGEKNPTDSAESFTIDVPQKDYNPVLPELPLPPNGTFAKGMMIDCVFAMHNLQSMEKQVDAAFKTWCSVIRYPLFDPLFEIPTTPRLLMAVDGRREEDLILLDVLRGRATSIAEEQAGY
ncbi:hypothetical protein C8F01DRAFT_1092002 [Mycena amicta]|nr:hypothetical protein C8F01DRAFT_1092002 [Mycena amicta]